MKKVGRAASEHFRCKCPLVCAVGLCKNDHYSPFDSGGLSARCVSLHVRNGSKAEWLTQSKCFRVIRAGTSLELALTASGCDKARVVHKLRLLSDIGSSYISGDLAKWLDSQYLMQTESLFAKNYEHFLNGIDPKQT